MAGRFAVLSSKGSVLDIVFWCAELVMKKNEHGTHISEY